MEKNQYILSPEEHQRIYHKISAKYLDPVPVSDHPKAYFLGGQPGSGKTKMRNLAEEQFPSVIVNTDDLRIYHPEYKTLMVTRPGDASDCVNHDAAQWSKRLLHDAIATRRNIVFDSTFGTGDQKVIAETLQSLKSNGFDMELWILAVPGKISRLGIYLRNESMIQRSGAGRFVQMDNHDTHYRNIPKNIDLAVQSGAVNRICIFQREIYLESGQIKNNKIQVVRSFAASDPNFKNASAVFRQIRDEPFSDLLKNYYAMRVTDVTKMIDQRLETTRLSCNQPEISVLMRYRQQFAADVKIDASQEMSM